MWNYTLSVLAELNFRLRKFFGIDAEIGKVASLILSVLPFIVLFAGYSYMAHIRHIENPSDRLTPTAFQIADAFYRTAFVRDSDGVLRLWVDTIATGKRFLMGLFILFGAIIFGLNMGLLKFVEKLFLKFILFLDNIPPMALLAILFIVFGTGEESKIFLIAFGTFPKVVMDVYWATKDIPNEQTIKGYTLGASDYQIGYRIFLPQIYPKGLVAIMSSIGLIIGFLIAAEAITAQSGLGYRIFIVKRFLGMDIIIAYVMWMAGLAFLLKLLFKLWVKYPKKGNRIMFWTIISILGMHLLLINFFHFNFFSFINSIGGRKGIGL